MYTICLPSPAINIKLAKEASNLGVCIDHRVECASAGTAWLLQFIEDLQQSRAFHETCKLILPSEAATIPEVCSLSSYTAQPSAESYHQQPCVVQQVNAGRDYTRIR